MIETETDRHRSALDDSIERTDKRRQYFALAWNDHDTIIIIISINKHAKAELIYITVER